jgi:hypothetical protein
MDLDREHTPQLQIDLECISPVLTGSDTTAASIRAAILYVSTNKLARMKMLEEFDQVEIGDYLSSSIKFHEPRKLKYLEAANSVSRTPLLGGPPFQKCRRGSNVA